MDGDGEMINTVVLPLVNVSRRLPDNTVNPKEPNQSIIYMTSAGSKTTFAYDALIDYFEESIINPDNAFVFGCDYRVPMMHGLVEKSYINKLKMSPSYNEESFGREFLSLWGGASDDSWFSVDKLTRYRQIKNPEVHQNFIHGYEQFYILSVDVGRISDQTVVCVLKVTKGTDKFFTSLVNLFVLGRSPETKPFQVQSADLKKLILRYDPREVVIDTNGIGVGLADNLIRPQFDEKGNELPAFGFINDENYKKIQPKDAPRILYGVKANAKINSEIHANCYTRIQNGLVRFLISEQKAKSALLSTKVGQKMSVEQRVKRILPHEMTTRLFQEMANLKLRRTGAGLDIALDRINPHYPKDKYSAFSYGLWRVKELEEQYTKSHRRRGIVRNLVFFTGGGEE